MVNRFHIDLYYELMVGGSNLGAEVGQFLFFRWPDILPLPTPAKTLRYLKEIETLALLLLLLIKLLLCNSEEKMGGRGGDHFLRHTADVKGMKNNIPDWQT